MNQQRNEEIFDIMGEEIVRKIYEKAGNEAVYPSALMRIPFMRKMKDAIEQTKNNRTVANKLGVCERTARRHRDRLNKISKKPRKKK